MVGECFRQGNDSCKNSEGANKGREGKIRGQEEGGLKAVAQAAADPSRC